MTDQPDRPTARRAAVRPARPTRRRPAARARRPARSSTRATTSRPERGPGLGCFRFQVVILVIFIFLTPLSVVWNWPPIVSTILLFSVILLLLVTGQTIIFLLRLVSADRRGRRRPLASGTKTVGELEDTAAVDTPEADRSRRHERPGRDRLGLARGRRFLPVTRAGDWSGAVRPLFELPTPVQPPLSVDRSR